MEKNLPLEMFLYEALGGRSKKGHDTKVVMIKAAIDCLADLGFERTNYETIAQRASKLRAHVAYHFESKDEIIFASVQYIVAVYRYTLEQHLLAAPADESKVLRYVEAPFVWAQRYPKQLSVMLLLYYLCAIRQEYVDLHNEIRCQGMLRIVGFLQRELDTTPSKAELRFLAKSIQNIVSGSIVDAATTKERSMKQAKNEAIRLVELILKGEPWGFKGVFV